MDMDRLNRWITLGANVGILIGLILVVYEIRQNSALVRAQISAVAFSDQKALAIAKMGDNYPQVLARSIKEPASLTLDDVVVLQSALEARLLEFRSAGIMEELGVFTGRWRQDLYYSSRPFTTPIGRKYWDYWYDDKVDWMRDVQANIESTEPIWESDFLETLRKSLVPDKEDNQ